MLAAYYMAWVNEGQLVQLHQEAPRRVTKKYTADGFTTLWLGDGSTVRGPQQELINVVVENDDGPEALVEMMRL